MLQEPQTGSAEWLTGSKMFECSQNSMVLRTCAGKVSGSGSILRDRRSASAVPHSLGALHIRLGEPNKAIAAYEQIIVTGNLHESSWRSGADRKLGAAHASIGDVNKAILYYEDPLKSALGMGHM